MTVNKYRDFAERVGWTAIYAAASAGITAMSSPDLDLETGLKLVGTATILAVLKVITAQQFGDRGSGDAIPGGVEK